MKRSFLFSAFIAASLFVGALHVHADPSTYGPELQGFDYPWPVHDFAFQSQGEAVVMRYMDVTPARPNGKIAVVLHGKNFCAATWEQTIRTLNDAGYRVIAPDQIGFANEQTRALSVLFPATRRATRMRSRFTGDPRRPSSATRPEACSRPATRSCLPVDSRRSCWSIRSASRTGKRTACRRSPSMSNRAREGDQCGAAFALTNRSTYYAGQWRPDYDRWVRMLAGYAGARKKDRRMEFGVLSTT